METNQTLELTKSFEAAGFDAPQAQALASVPFASVLCVLECGFGGVLIGLGYLRL